METTITTPGRLTDRDLLARVHCLARGEREATASVVAHLAELDERRLYLNEGYSSLFVYCTKALHYSESAAWNRQEAARAVRQFPMILDLLATGDITLTTIRLLRPHLTPDNYRQLLARARHRSKREIERLIAEIRPLPDVKTVVRKLAARPMVQVPVLATVRSADAAVPGPGVVSGVRVITGLAPRPAILMPLSPDRYKVQFTASREMCERIERLRELLRHRIPDGNLADLLELATIALLEKVERQKFAATRRPRAATGSNAAADGPRGERDSGVSGGGAPGRDVESAGRECRHIPADVRREVWHRDKGQCAFRSSTGRRCEERGRLKFHHLEPYAIGGKATTENIALRCTAYNRHEAVITLGKGVAERGMGRDAGRGTRVGKTFSFRNESDRALPGP